MKNFAASEISYQVSANLSDDTLNWLARACWPDHEDEQFGQVLERSLLYVSAHHDERLIGFVNLAWDGGEHAFLLDTRVDPEFRRCGIGTELVKRAVSAAKDRDIKWVHVDFEPHLSSFYSNCGFRDTEAGLVQLG